MIRSGDILLSCFGEMATKIRAFKENRRIYNIFSKLTHQRKIVLQKSILSSQEY